MSVIEHLQDHFTDLFHGVGLDEGFTPEEFADAVKVAADVWLASDTIKEWIESDKEQTAMEDREDEARERALEEKVDREGYKY